MKRQNTLLKPDKDCHLSLKKKFIGYLRLEVNRVSRAVPGNLARVSKASHLSQKLGDQGMVRKQLVSNTPTMFLLSHCRDAVVFLPSRHAGMETIERCNICCFFHEGGRAWLAQLVRSLPSDHKVPSSIRGSAEI